MKGSRRDFLKTAGLSIAGSLQAHRTLATPPVAALASLFMQSEFAKAADTQGSMLDRHYLAVILNGGPNRWVFDQWLKPKGEQIVANPMVATRFTGSGQYTGASYQTFDYKGVQVPALWATNVAASGGGMRPMSALLDHMMVIRGYGSGVDGHGVNVMRQFQPITGIESLSGYVSDRSRRLVGTLQYPSFVSSFTGYFSLLGSNAISVHPVDPKTNLLAQALRPFNNRAVGTSSLRERYAELVEAAGAVFKDANFNRSPGSQVVHLDTDSAKARLKNGFAELEQVWPTLYAKYYDIFARTLRDRTAVGYTDLPVLASDDGKSTETRYSVNIAAKIFYPQSGLDIRDWMAAAEAVNAAQSFALAEFAITRDLATSLEIGNLIPSAMKGQFVRNNNGVFAEPTSHFFSFDTDEHGTGQMSSLLINSCFYRSIAAALLELVDRLRAAGKFDKTMIHITSEFGRTPRQSGGGSDHGYDAMISSLITGRNNLGPLVVGNILKDGTGGALNAAYTGTFGYRAPTQIGSGQVLLNPSHVASTIAAVMGYPSNPWETQGAPLVTVENGMLKVLASGEVRS